MKYLILVLIIVFVGCSKPVEKPIYSGDHDTETIRGMWHVCYMTHKKVNRFAPELYLWKLCDCVIDKSREEYKSTEYEKYSGDNLTKFFKDANLECALKIKQVEPKMPQLGTM